MRTYAYQMLPIWVFVVDELEKLCWVLLVSVLPLSSRALSALILINGSGCAIGLSALVVFSRLAFHTVLGSASTHREKHAELLHVSRIRLRESARRRLARQDRTCALVLCVYVCASDAATHASLAWVPSRTPAFPASAVCSCFFLCALLRLFPCAFS
eukprot:490479-Pleurochrysis_carterae.AAC.1